MTNYNTALTLELDAPIKPACKALYVGKAGDLTVDVANSGKQVFKNVPVGIFPIAVSKVHSDSKATDIVGLR